MTDTRPLPERMFEAGFTDLIPVIPPGATLAPSSKIAPSSIGKIPGKRLPNGLWVGINWRETKATIEDVREWAVWGSNVGLRSDSYPGVDIDCADVALAQIIEDAALSQLGPAPIRIGNPPKRLLPYRSGEPFGRMRLWMRKGDTNHLVEVLGQGTQYLVHGTHPTTQLPYHWSMDPAGLTTDGLTRVDRTGAERFLMYMKDVAEMLGYECKREGDGSQLATRSADQIIHRAPSMAELQRVIELLPNTDTLFPSRTDWLKVGAAIRASAGEENEPEAFNLFALWSDKWDGGTNIPEYVRDNWRRIRPPFSVGYSFLAEMARPYGYNDTTFPVDEMAQAPEEASRAPFLSDQWLALKVVEAAQPILRYVPALEQWLVWNRGRWQPDAEMLAEDTVKLELRKIAQKIGKMGTTEKEIKAFEQESKAIASAGKVSGVAGLVKSDRAIAVSPESLDFDSWLLNTPGGMVNLRTGVMQAPDPDQLCTKSTSVTPDFHGAHPVWDRFLEEATAGDVGLRQYLQRLGGYALTGSTQEQQYTFIYGPGGNGKGVFLRVLMEIFGTYHKDAAMDTFIASNNERHSTELAGLQGARLVTASETQAGKRWDEAKLKRMTGGDPITARFMREDFITYQPQFTLIFIGNNKPEIRNLDKAMRRRTHLAPFTVTPKVVDQELPVKLRAEYPAILAWLIRGTLEWHKQGLNPPSTVREATEAYFDESDPIGQWLAENAEPSNEWADLVALFDNWKEWTNRRGEYTGKIQRFASMLEARHCEKRKHPDNRRIQFQGFKLVNRPDLLEVVA